MIDTKPYVYILKDRENGMYYVGSRWKKGCHPTEFWTKGGYNTSSKVISELVDQYGLERFTVKKVIQREDAYEYESRLLQRVDAASNPLFYNQTNNNFTHTSKIEGMSKKQQKKREENLKAKYGKDLKSYMQIEEIKNKATDNHRKSMLDKYGVTGALQIDSVNRLAQKNKKNTLIKKYGVDSNFKLPSVIEKTKEVRKKREDREIVKLLKQIKEDYIVFGSGWQQKSDEALEALYYDTVNIVGTFSEEKAEQYKIDFKNSYRKKLSDAQRKRKHKK